MTSAFLGFLLAVLSVWDYPARQFQHEALRNAFVQAMRRADREQMLKAAEAGVKLLPDDPTWHYNLACALAYQPKREHKTAFDELEKAIDLGFRDVKLISSDLDLRRLDYDSRYAELLEYAEMMSGRPLVLGPNAHVTATGVAGHSVAFGEQNLVWDLSRGLFEVDLRLEPFTPHGNLGDLYMNRDNHHSCLDMKAFPGLTEVGLDRAGHQRGMDLDAPNMLFPYPLFGNASRAFVDPKLWRSIPRMMMTRDAWRMNAMMNLYLANQIWVFPAHQDCPPVGKCGDVFASISPYFLVTEGSSYTDKPYLACALAASKCLKPGIKAEIVKRGLLAPTLMTLIRKSLRNVTNETDYLSVKAHPTAFAAGRVDVGRLKTMAMNFTTNDIPPLAPLTIGVAAVTNAPAWPEATYLTPYSSAFVLRSADTNRSFLVCAVDPSKLTLRSGLPGGQPLPPTLPSDDGLVGGDHRAPRAPGVTFAFSLLRDGGGAAKLTQKSPEAVAIDIDRSRMTGTKRIDLAVFAKTSTSGWGAPSYVSFAVMDPSAPYCDPVLTPAVKK